MDYPFSQLLMVVQCQRPSAILNHQDFPLRTFAIKRHWHQAKKLLEEASRQQLMLRFGTLITCAIARCRNHQLEHFPNSAATLWYNRTNYSGDMIPLYLLKMLDSKMMSSTAPKVSRIFSVLVTRVRWLLEHHPLDASCWNPPILARAYPFYSVPFFIFFLHLRVSKFKSLQVFFWGGGVQTRLQRVSRSPTTSNPPPTSPTWEVWRLRKVDEDVWPEMRQWSF